MTGWIYVHDINPVLIQLGPLRIGWYGLMYAMAFITTYPYLTRLSRKPGAPMQAQDVANFLTYIILGVIVGGRVGWVIFYDMPFNGVLPYLEQPWRIFQTWKGGMAFHGGMLGVIGAFWIYARRHRISIVALGDYLSGWVPVGLMLGRIGNFINGELYGMPTDGSWGVIFPGDSERLPRHPSQLYEAFAEGVVIFLVLLWIRRRGFRRGHPSAVFLMLYGAFRYGVEFVRLPDDYIGYLWGTVTAGQLYSLPMMVVGMVWTALLFTRPAPQTD